MCFRSYRSVFVFIIICLLSACSSPEKSDHENFARLSVLEDPQSLDPRKMRDVGSVNLAHLFYEGLTRMSLQGTVELGAAEDINVSRDGKTYTIKLKNGLWSDGSPITADDFVETWKSTLDPTFPAPNAYQLYVIEGAKEAKEGIIPLDAIGLKVLNPTTFSMTLKDPTPYLMELFSCPFFYPVHISLRTDSADSLPISNGPFKLVKIQERQEYLFEKNNHYKRALNVKLPGVSIKVLAESTALQLFLAGQLDWAGSPISTLPQDAIRSLVDSKKLQTSPAAATYWFRFNTSRPPFNNQSMRRAFALAIDRQSIVDHVTQGNQLPALAIVPPILGLSPKGILKDNNIVESKQFFSFGLADLKLKSPLIVTLRCVANDRSLKIAQAIQQQWENALGVKVIIESSEFKTNFERMKAGDYDICYGSWFADISDPVNFLEIFKSKENPTNQTFWENKQYSALLDQAAQATEKGVRFLLLSQAEGILLEELPVAPLMYPTFNYLKSDRLQGVYVSPLGYLDLLEAFIVP